MAFFEIRDARKAAAHQLNSALASARIAHEVACAHDPANARAHGLAHERAYREAYQVSFAAVSEAKRNGWRD